MNGGGRRVVVVVVVAVVVVVVVCVRTGARVRASQQCVLCHMRVCVRAGSASTTLGHRTTS